MIKKKLTKGERTRESILNEARRVFNEEGFFLTLSAISKKIGITSGGITNHFPTKEHLIVGLAEQYELEIEQLTSTLDYGSGLDFKKIVTFYGRIMDIQFKHRSVILYFSAAHQSQTVLFSQVTKTWVYRQSRLELMANAFVKAGLVDSNILDPQEFPIFRFQWINLFTTWLVSYSLYDSGKEYEEMKPIYLSGILRVFDKYLTEKGRAQMSAIHLT
ncbi:TetR/AcrR family transcriptional regulator [Shivajiella indica]|uniref:TetR/AcrR family transcriptional regulator n=1 Tax=Shivajiella indica TaxID=872115 RepID=A0ABW5B3S0_9BACT